MKSNDVFKNKCLSNKESIKGKKIRVSGKGYKIAGAGKDNLLLRTLAPKGISNKPVDSKVWIEWGNISVELSREVSKFFPKNESTNEVDYVQELLEFEKEIQEVEE